MSLLHNLQVVLWLCIIIIIECKIEAYLWEVEVQNKNISLEKKKVARFLF